MKKYYFKDDYTVKCENLTASEIKEQEAVHGTLKGVKISGFGYVKCKRSDGVPSWRIKIGGEYNPYLGCSKEQIDDAPTVIEGEKE